jgi:hypothetical protein
MKLVLPSSVSLKIDRRGTVCHFVYTETMDPKTCRHDGKLVGKRKLVGALKNTLAVARRMVAELPAMAGLKVTCPTPLSIRIAGTANTKDFGLFMLSEFQCWCDDEWLAMAERLGNAALKPGPIEMADVLADPFAAAVAVPGVDP